MGCTTVWSFPSGSISRLFSFSLSARPLLCWCGSGAGYILLRPPCALAPATRPKLHQIIFSVFGVAQTHFYLSGTTEVLRLGVWSSKWTGNRLSIGSRDNPSVLIPLLLSPESHCIGIGTGLGLVSQLNCLSERCFLQLHAIKALESCRPSRRRLQGGVNPVRCNPLPRIVHEMTTLAQEVWQSP